MRRNPLVYIIEGYRKCLLYGEGFWSSPGQGAYFWLAALALLLVQSVYLVGRSAAQWALGVSASAVAAAVACGLDESRENGRLHLLVVPPAAAAAAIRIYRKQVTSDCCRGGCSSCKKCDKKR